VSLFGSSAPAGTPAVPRVGSLAPAPTGATTLASGPTPPPSIAATTSAGTLAAQSAAAKQRLLAAAGNPLVGGTPIPLNMPTATFQAKTLYGGTTK